MTRQITIRAERERYTVALGVHGSTEHLRGSHPSAEAAEEHARAVLAERGEEPGDVVRMGPGNAGDEGRRLRTHALMERIGAEIPDAYGYAVLVTIPSAAAAALSRCTHGVGSPRDAAALESITAEDYAGPRPITHLCRSLPGRPRDIVLTDAGHVLAEACRGQGRRVIVCAGWHRRGQDCARCGGVAWAAELLCGGERA